MLNRISAAIANAIQPISSSKTSADRDPDGRNPGGSAGGFKRADLKLLKVEPESPPSDAGQAPVAKRAYVAPGPLPAEAVTAPDASGDPAAVSAADAARTRNHQLMGLSALWSFMKSSIPLSRWFGVTAYQSAMKRSKRTSSFRKGAILDRKAE